MAEDRSCEIVCDGGVVTGNIIRGKRAQRRHRPNHLTPRGPLTCDSSVTRLVINHVQPIGSRRRPNVLRVTFY